MTLDSAELRIDVLDGQVGAVGVFGVAGRAVLLVDVADLDRSQGAVGGACLSAGVGQCERVVDRARGG